MKTAGALSLAMLATDPVLGDDKKPEAKGMKPKLKEKHTPLKLDEATKREDKEPEKRAVYTLYVANRSASRTIIGIKIVGGSTIALPQPIGQTCTEACANCGTPPKCVTATD